MSKDQKNEPTCTVTPAPHGFRYGQYMTFKGIKGLKVGRRPVKVVSVESTTITIETQRSKP